MFLSWKAFFVSPFACSSLAVMSGMNVVIICKTFRYKSGLSDESIVVLLQTIP